MSSTCVLSPNAFSSQSVAMDSSVPHPALRGWNNSAPIPALLDQDYNPTANEVMQGSVTLLSSTRGPQRIRLSVIRTSVDHFALVYPDTRRKMESVKPAGCVNLRGVTCEETVLGNGITGFTLRPKKCDTSSATLTFVCSETLLLPRWIEAMTPLSAAASNRRNIPKKCSLPSLEEEEE